MLAELETRFPDHDLTDMARLELGLPADGNPAAVLTSADMNNMGAVNSAPATGIREFYLAQSQPNPFTEQTTISYQLPALQAVSLRIYNTAGQLVRTLVDTEVPAGVHEVIWDGTNDNGQMSGSGVYVYRLEAGAVTAQQRMVFFK